MGIRGLYSMIANDENYYQIVDLVKEAANSKNGIEILVDFHSFQREIVRITTLKITHDFKNNYYHFPTPDYDIYIESFANFEKYFKEAGIKLIWIIDGPKGVDDLASTQKKETWIDRDRSDITQLNKVLEGSSTKTPPKDLNNLGPLFGFEMSIDALKRAGAKIIQLFQGGADEFIAYEFRKGKAFAIISADTDYLVFRDCKVIFPRLMNKKYNNDDLKLPFIDENYGQIFKKPEEFRCPIVNQNNVLQLLKLTNHSEMVAVSFIKGNDNIEEYAQNLQNFLKISKNTTKNAHVTQVAKFVANNEITEENIYTHDKIEPFLSKNNPKIKKAIQFCYDFYNLKHFEKNMEDSLIVSDLSLNDNNSLTSYLRKKLENSEINKKVYSIHCGIFHDSILMEYPGPNCLSNSLIMADIRAKIYPYLLDNKYNKIIEWRTRSSKGFDIPVEHSAIKTNNIKGKRESDLEIEDSIIYGIDLFEEIWSHLEEGSLKYFERFGIECGFLCYLLRYFYQINKTKNLDISPNEFRSLFVTVFYKYADSKKIEFKSELKRNSFLKMAICPSHKCLIIHSWFMNIYFTGKYLCGGALNLTLDFPSLDQVMNGSVLIAFYEKAMENQNKRISHLVDSLQDEIETLENEVIKKYSEEYDCLTQ